jgi:NAD-dependent SIR2 family protein deacetylase
MPDIRPEFLPCFEARCENCGGTVYHDMNPGSKAKERPHYCPACGKFVVGEGRMRKVSKP